ncbi:carbohydrate kinase family protein [Caldilinea sp.]|uniref:carbohydrate kinase family protein n=2 Tax=Caldilinea sp. TaxID=2293560 RepID=UPI0021DDADFC|nr:sugar kinase [Caldilinea sp.]GIV68241.1 MAG: ribokinase [Caldilinea sp.]
MKKFDVVAVGDLNGDLILSGDVTPVFGQVEKVIDDATLTVGGSTAIFACGAARLGLRVAFVGKVGCDPIGDFLLDALTARGIDVAGVRRDQTVKTGLTTVLSRGADRAMLTYLGTLATLHSADIAMEIVAQARHLHLGSFYMLNALRPHIPRLFAEAKAHGLTVSLDTNYDPTEQWAGGIDEALAHADIFLPNETELKAIARCEDWRTALAQLAARTPIVAVKRGGEGAAAQRGQQVVEVSAPKVQVVDATGAGDSFNAGFVYGHLAGWPLARALAFAVACGSASTRAAGGVESQPTLAEAMALMNLDCSQTQQMAH